MPPTTFLPALLTTVSVYRGTVRSHESSESPSTSRWNRHYPVQGVSLVVLGGHDVGNADRSVIEGDFSSWLFLHSRHPIDFSFTSTHFHENGVTSTLMEVRTIVYSTGKWLFLAGGGGAFWGGATERKPNGQGRPDLGFFSSRMGSELTSKAATEVPTFTVRSLFPRL